MMRRWIALGAALCLVAPALAQKPSRPALRAAAAITATDLRDYLAFIASDALQGRDTPSPGLDAAAEFLAFHLRRFGLKPAGDEGTFFQKITLERSTGDLTRCRVAVDGKALTIGEDALPYAQSGHGNAEGPLLYVGHGWQVPARGIDAYGKVEVRGKILVVSGAAWPQGFGIGDANDVGVEGYLTPERYAARHGALGVVRLSLHRDGADWDQMRRDATASTSFSPRAASTGGRVPSVTLSPAASRALLAGLELSAAQVEQQARQGDGAAPWPFPATRTLQFSVANRTETRTTQNVVAIWPGADAKLSEEFVALGAHYDHVGVASSGPEGSDRIFNGADDDGSGTVALLAMAQALSQGPVRPRRSLLFVWHCGEEKGLWGSAHYTDRPTVPIEKIVTQLNIDMIGRSRPAGGATSARVTASDEIFVIGSRKLSTQLGQLVERVNEASYRLRYNFHYDAPNDPEGLYYRSDHFSYARKNIPIAFWFDGIHEDYHRVGDEVGKIDFGKLEKVTRTIFLTALTVADLAQRPAVDGKNE